MGDEIRTFSSNRKGGTYSPAREGTEITSRLGGIGVDPPIDNSGDAAGLVQAMASLGGGSGAADGLNAAGFDTDVSQHQFLTAPQ